VLCGPIIGLNKAVRDVQRRLEKHPGDNESEAPPLEGDDRRVETPGQADRRLAKPET